MNRIITFFLFIPIEIVMFNVTYDNRIYQIGEIFSLQITKTAKENQIIQFTTDQTQYEVDFHCKETRLNRLFSCNESDLLTKIKFKIYPLKVDSWKFHDYPQTFSFALNINYTKLWLLVYNFDHPFYRRSSFNYGDRVCISCSVSNSIIQPNLSLTTKAQ